VDERSILLLAVADLVADGVRLEGRGVSPDVTVDAPLPYRQGVDTQLEAALAELRSLVASRRRGSGSGG
jgi:C-terminal processing protease CtpA/Prc